MAEALFEAVCDGDLARLRAVLATGVDVDSEAINALRLAACSGRPSFLEALLAAGASVTDWRPLYYASVGGHVACVRALIVAGADVNGAAASWSTNSTVALACGHSRVLKILLRAGADLRTDFVSRHDADNAEAWKLVDAIRKVGGWPQYVTRRRATLTSVVKKATWNKLPHVMNLEIGAFVEPPGGY